MNSKLTAITLFTVISIIAISQFHCANAELQSGKSYIIYANGHDIGNRLEYTLEFQLLIGSGSSDKIPISLVEGLIIHDNKDFITSGNWKGTLLKNDGVMMLSGNATTFDGTQLSMILFGKLVNNTKDGANYRLVGSLTHENQRMSLTQVTEIVNVGSLTQNQIYKEMPHIFMNQHKALQILQVQPTKKTDAITLMVSHPDRAYIHNYVYSITTKVYMLKENPRNDFDLHGGEVQGAHITINIINQNNEIVKSIDGITDRFGYFSVIFIVPDNFAPGTYVVHVTAEKDGVNDTNDSTVNLFHPSIGDEGTNTQTSVISSDAPRGLTAVAQNKHVINLSWVPPSSPPSPIIQYQLEMESPIGGGWSVVATPAKNRTTYTDRGLASNTQYNYRISAIYADHISGPSNTAHATTQ